MLAEDQVSARLKPNWMTANFRQPAWVGEGRGWLTLFRAPPLSAVHQGRGPAQHPEYAT